METLVRRLGRIFSRKQNDSQRSAGGGPVVQQAYQPDRHSWRMEQLAEALEEYVRQQGWRKPVRTVGEAAERLGTDTRTLHHYFQQRVGMDFRTWRTRLRLEDAKRLLAENPGLPASDAGRRAGFSNRSNFARQFLAYTGVTPARWQKGAGMSHDSPAPENDYV